MTDKVVHKMMSLYKFFSEEFFDVLLFLTYTQNTSDFGQNRPNLNPKCCLHCQSLSLKYHTN
jgi:hypothetical protein